MRIRIDYETAYAYASPVQGALQQLKLTPRDHAGQRVARWRVEVDADGRLRRGEDGFGNIQHTFTLGAPSERVVVRASGEVDVGDVAGVLGALPERLPPGVYLRSTPLTAPDAALDALAVTATGAGRLDRLHALMGAVRERVRFDTEATSPSTTAAQALELGRGVCQDLSHVFIAAARRMGAPARYVSGHLLRPGTPEQTAAHAWAEAWVDDLGWVGFDPTNGVCPADRHLRVAVGPDYLAAAPFRGARRGGGEETMRVRLLVADASRPSGPAPGGD